ncbi:MAG: DTW domain-containing protein [Helicobacteraceae bacterium]|jgi:DTW domain-containing protein YfiP|nr:DTW domain-containing protein [Helicobacteraceae bacterium]
MGASKRNEVNEARGKCYHCYRPLSSCMCAHVKPVQTNTKFVILMHPKEFQKVKNGTGHLTHLSLPNSALYIGVDFRDNKQVNALLEDEKNLCMVLYPDEKSHNLNKENIPVEGRQLVIFIIDATWSTAIKLLKVSTNLQALPKLSFTHTKSSQFQIKEQPEEYCLSTIESTLTILELLNKHHMEAIEKESFESFLDPFKAMIEYQIACISESKSSHENAVRFKRRAP